jgi:MFS transporter, SP family, galactose:H+ symporter
MALLSHHAQHHESQPGHSGKPSYAHIYIFSAVAAIGGLLFGYDTGTISGAELLLRKDFALNPVTEELVVSAILIGAIVGAAVGGKLSDAIGRKLTTIVVAIIFAAGVILTALAPNLVFFIAFRMLVGLSLGIAALVVPVYISEIAPPAKRGSLVTFNQFAIAGGVPIAYWIDLACTHVHLSWRPLFGFEAIPAIVLGIAMLFLPESPRWLASKGRWNEAGQTLERLDVTRKDEDLKAMRKALQAGKHSSVSELFRTGLRKALIVGVGLAIIQQVIGSAAISYYTPTIFKYAGLKSSSTDILVTSIVAVDAVVAAIVAIFLLDRLGRRPLLFASLIGIIVPLAIIGVVFATGTSSAGYLVLICLLVYIFAYGIGIGPIFSLMCSAIFPTKLRGTGVSIATFANWLATLLVSISFLTLINHTGKPLTFWIYAILAIIGLVFCWFLVPETKGKTLEQIEEYWEK